MTDGLKIDGLKNILKALKDRQIVARVGVLGKSNARDGGVSNAEIGAAHEYGAPERNLPQRSFLRMPISAKLQGELESSNVFTTDALKEVISTKEMKPWVEKMAICATAVIADAFDSNGFGQWAPLTEATKSRKKLNQILVETQQLRNSITWDVTE